MDRMSRRLKKTTLSNQHGFNYQEVGRSLNQLLFSTERLEVDFTEFFKGELISEHVARFFEILFGKLGALIFDWATWVNAIA